MPPSERPADFATLASRRVDAGRSLVVHVAAEPDTSAATTARERIGEHLDAEASDTERVAVTDTGESHRFLESAASGSLLVLEHRASETSDATWGPLVTLFANARYRGVHVVLATTEVPLLVSRGVNVRVEPAEDGLGVALLEPAADDPERTQEIDLGTL
jgi:hypothetical protein